MPTWKRKEGTGAVAFHHVCGDCNDRIAGALEKAGWMLLRDGEPVVCSECSLNCRLTAEECWGAADEVRYAMCAACADHDRCALQGRYYC